MMVMTGELKEEGGGMRAYSQDLRERVLAFVDEGHQLGDAVETFKVSSSWLRNLLRRRDATGQVEAKPHGGGNPGKFEPDDLALLNRLCEEHPDAFLRELADMLAEAGGPRVQPSTIFNRLKELGLTRKKKTLRATEQDAADVQAQREAFRKAIAAINPLSLVFLDESGVNRGMTRLFARSMHNTRARASAPINIGCNMSIVAALRLEQGVIGAMTTEGAFDGPLFLTFVKEILVPVLRPGDHVVMDNLGAHRSAGVVEAIEAASAHVIMLPPYSPDFDPVEHLWSSFKAWMRGQAARTKEALEAAIAKGLFLVTPTQVLGWYKGCGYV